MNHKLHPGQAILRALIPSTDHRRRFVCNACRQDTWSPAALIRAVSDANEGPINVTPEQARQVRAFIESI